jgi:3-oxoacyl-[acyl-carrier protein] reductase
MAIELNDKVCLITGADHGLGRGLVHGFLQRGARVAAGLLQPPGDKPTTSHYLAVAMDVTQPDQVAAAVAQVVAHFGRLDVLINNAGIYPRQAADTMSPEQWRQVMGINLDGAWHCNQAAIPHFKRQGDGVILHVGSVTLHLGEAELSHYLASKGGLVGLTRGLARDLGPHGIRVNCVHLGAIQTEGELRLFPDQAAVELMLNQKQALPGRQTPATVEPVFAFLASDEGRDITGQCLTVDRGWTHG